MAKSQGTTGTRPGCEPGKSNGEPTLVIPITMCLGCGQVFTWQRQEDALAMPACPNCGEPWL